MIYKMIIEFDVEKVEREGKYDINKMWAMVDEFLVGEYKLKKTDPGVYVDYPGVDGYVAQMCFATSFKRRSWFFSNLRKWESHELEGKREFDPDYEDWKAAYETRKAS